MVGRLSALEPRFAMTRSRAVIEQGIDTGLHLGAQVHAAIGGQIVADFGLGQARPGVPMTADTLMLWMSSGKPIGAASVLQLAEHGKLALDDPVARHIPEFAAHGKQDITLRHILTHTAGFRWIEVDAPRSSWEEIIDRICNSKPERDWPPGKKAGYHPASSWHILGEVVRRADGRTYSDYVREEIFLPLGMVDSWFGMSEARYHAYGDRISHTRLVDRPAPVTHIYDKAVAAAICVPGGNGHGPMHDLGRFYQMLLGGGQLDGVQCLTRESVRMMTTPQRVGMFDETFKHVIDWGLGMMIDSKRYGDGNAPYGYGSHSSARTFGHSGKQSSIGMADPEQQLVVAVAFNAMPGEEKHEARMRAMLTAIYEDLALS